MLISQTKIEKKYFNDLNTQSPDVINFSYREKNVCILQIIHVYYQLEVGVNVFLNMRKIYTIRCL